MRYSTDEDKDDPSADGIIPKSCKSWIRPRCKPTEPIADEEYELKGEAAILLLTLSRLTRCEIVEIWFLLRAEN